MQIYGQISKRQSLCFLFILKTEEHRIVELTYANTEHTNPSEGKKDVRIDVECTDADGTRFVVEVQVADQFHFYERAVFNSSFAILQQKAKGELDYDFPTVYFIGIMDFSYHVGSDCVDFRYTIRENSSHELMTPRVQYIFLELPNSLNKGLKPGATVLENICYALHQMEHLTEQPAELKQEIFKLLFESAEIATFTPEERIKYQNDMTTASSEALYLEYLGIQKAIEMGTYNMEENAQVPPMPPISFGKRVEMDQFFEEIQIFLKFFGCHIFEKLGRKRHATKPIPSHAPTPCPTPAPIPIPTPPSPTIPGASLPYKEYHFAIKKAGMSSRLRYYPDQDKYVILSGSLINAFNAPSLQPSIASFRNSVFSSSSCTKKGDLYQLLEDIEIPNGSPSAAAKFCAGTSRNGKTDWVDDNGHSIGEYLDGRISS